MSDKILEIGEYKIPEDCCAKVMGKTITVKKKACLKLPEGEYRCKDCKHRVRGISITHYETDVCELKRKGLCSYDGKVHYYACQAYDKICENFELKEGVK
jgi:hypothetical protein